eukprot:1956835-Prymnesium_polylepis.1
MGTTDNHFLDQVARPRPRPPLRTRRWPTVVTPSQHRLSDFAFDDTTLLIEDPEGNKLRSLQINPLIESALSPRYPTEHRIPCTPFLARPRPMTPVAASRPSLPRGYTVETARKTP